METTGIEEELEELIEEEKETEGTKEGIVEEETEGTEETEALNLLLYVDLIVIVLHF